MTTPRKEPSRPVAVVSGAGSGGIGTSIATRLLKNGYFVVPVERTEENSN